MVTADLIAQIEKRDRYWSDGDFGPDKTIHEHPDTQCSADLDRHELLAILRAEPSRSSPDPDLPPDVTSNDVYSDPARWGEPFDSGAKPLTADEEDRLRDYYDSFVVDSLGRPICRLDQILATIDAARLGSSPDLTGLDPLTLAAAMPGLSFDYDGHRVYLALYQPDLTGDAIVSAEMGYWLRAARALAARLSPAPETDPSQVER